MIKKVINKGNVPVKIWTDDVESSAIDQLVNVANLPKGIIHKHVAVMPDVHMGKGCTIGSVIPTHKAIIPAAVGVDIGCGMMAVQTNLTSKKLPTNMKEIREAIERGVPLGSGGRHTEKSGTGYFPLEFAKDLSSLNFRFMDLKGLNKFILKKEWNAQLGTLGSGNHFIEICLDKEDNVWIMLHSGSRGIGNMIGTHFIAEAKKDMERWMINLPDKDLSYLPEGSEHFQNYVDAVSWAQDYAMLNRELMMAEIIKNMKHYIPSMKILDAGVNCHHNYVEQEHHYGKNVWVTRKGAIRAREGDMGIIPGSMGARSFIVKGKGNPESFCSCSHGAGRKMSRSAAKNLFTTEDLKNSMGDVEYHHRKSLLDEHPDAYKDIDIVMDNQSDLVEVVHELKQIVSIKGD